MEESLQSLWRNKVLRSKRMRHTSLLLQTYVKLEEHSPSPAVSAGTKQAVTKVIFCNFSVCVTIVVLLKILQHQNLVYKLLILWLLYIRSLWFILRPWHLEPVGSHPLSKGICKTLQPTCKWREVAQAGKSHPMGSSGPPGWLTWHAYIHKCVSELHRMSVI